MASGCEDIEFGSHSLKRGDHLQVRGKLKIKTGKLELKVERAAQQSLSRITHWTMTEVQTWHCDLRSPNMKNVRNQTNTDRERPDFISSNRYRSWKGGRSLLRPVTADQSEQTENLNETGSEIEWNNAFSK